MSIQKSSNESSLNPTFDSKGGNPIDLVLKVEKQLDFFPLL